MCPPRATVAGLAALALDLAGCNPAPLHTPCAEDSDCPPCYRCMEGWLFCAHIEGGCVPDAFSFVVDAGQIDALSLADAAADALGGTDVGADQGGAADHSEVEAGLDVSSVDTQSNPDSAGGTDSAGSTDSAGGADSAGGTDSAGGADGAGGADSAGSTDSAGSADSAVTSDASAPADTAVTDSATAGDATLTDGLWGVIPGGHFQMGCKPAAPNLYEIYSCDDNVLPLHSVRVEGFKMMRAEVTQQQFKAIMGSMPSAHKHCDDCPVEQVTWQEARDFCQAAGGRLPSEAEWEYAARAGTSTTFSCGETAGCLDDVAWQYWGAGATTQPVATLAPNAFGLFDTHGNVREWVEDCWHASYDSAPGTGGVWAGGDCGQHPVRGSSVLEMSMPVYARGPEATTMRSQDIGFRCASNL